MFWNNFRAYLAEKKPWGTLFWFMYEPRLGDVRCTKLVFSPQSTPKAPQFWSEGLLFLFEAAYQVKFGNNRVGFRTLVFNILLSFLWFSEGWKYLRFNWFFVGELHPQNTNHMFIETSKYVQRSIYLLAKYRYRHTVNAIWKMFFCCIIMSIYIYSVYKHLPTESFAPTHTNLQAHAWQQMYMVLATAHASPSCTLHSEMVLCCTRWCRARVRSSAMHSCICGSLPSIQGHGPATLPWLRCT